MNNPFDLLKTIIISAVALLIAFMFFGRADTYLRLKAVDDCGRISRYEKNVTAEDAKVSYYLDDFYKQCLKDKGMMK